MVKLGLLYTHIRTDEKLLIQKAEESNLCLKLINIQKAILSPALFPADIDVALERSVSTVKGLYTTQFIESLGIPVVNSFAVSSICQDKFATSLKLQQSAVPTLKFSMVFDCDQAKEAVAELGGYPVVVKPTVGSWGRLLAKVNDDDALEAILEHKEVLGSPSQKAVYLQEYIAKPERDIRAFVVNHRVICAVYRNSKHWITNTARGGKAENCPVGPDLSEICVQASKAIGGGVLAMDVIETDAGLKINEVNHTMEFKNSEIPTGVSISGAVINYCREVAYG